MKRSGGTPPDSPPAKKLAGTAVPPEELPPATLDGGEHPAGDGAESPEPPPPPPPDDFIPPPPPDEDEGQPVAAERQRFQGTVVSFSSKKGFGFLRKLDIDASEAKDGGGDAISGDLFVHKNSIVTGGSAAANFVLSEGDQVSFFVAEQGDGKHYAVDVRTPSGAPFILDTKGALDLRWHAESWRGLKDEQQDRYTCGEDLGDLGTYFGVFDGHGGTFTSEWLAKNLHRSIASRRDALPRSWVPNEASTRDLLSKVFSATDKELIKLPGHAKTKDGSTALVTLITGDTPPAEGKQGDVKLVCANVGDCRAVLCRGGAAVPMSVDHKPNRGDEERRVRSAGGYVVNVGGIWRVTTASGAGASVSAKDHQYLAVSRSFGDTELKQPTQLVIATPEIKVFDVMPDDYFAVMCCDGIYDVLDDDEVVQVAGEHFGSPKDAAASVVRTAYNKGSGDNLTAIVIEFGWHASNTVGEALKKAKEGAAAAGADEDLDMFGD